MNKHTRGQRIGCLICVVSAGLMILLTVAFVRYAATHLRPAEESTLPAPVVAATVQTADMPGFCATAEAEPDMICPVIETYTDGDAPVPSWWNPDEPMAAEWTAETYNVIATNLQSTMSDCNTRRDVGCPDWNLDTTLYGWDGHSMEVWEMDLYSRILYKEFWGTSQECCEAGADSILRLWESGYFSDTMFGTLSAVTETGARVYSTYPSVWETVYDPHGLADMRRLCEERFVDGPSWAAEFFQLYSYPEWAVPMYELDGVYFSTSPYLH